MARNAEKAMTALSRWRRMKEEEEHGPKAQRPEKTRECTNLEDALRFRNELISEIAKKVEIIQNPGLGEYKIRDLNDEINELLKIKSKWETRIKELGGPDFKLLAPKDLDKEGREVLLTRGYKYFGAAKDLPGVRELFAPPKKLDEEEEPKKKSRDELTKLIDANYYGLMDDEDGKLVPLEESEKQKAIENINRQWEKNGPAMNQIDDSYEDELYAKVPELMMYEDDEIDTRDAVVIGEDGKEMVIKEVMVPSQNEIEEMLVERKKQKLWHKYIE